jgi:hypothetical protein
MAERRAGPGAENGGMEDADPRELRPADGVDTAMDAVQAASADAVLDRLGRHPQVEQLLPRHHSVLCLRQREHRRQRNVLRFTPHRGAKATKSEARP